MIHAETADHYRVIAEISNGGRTFPDVRCDIRLPKRSCGRIEVLCWLNQQQQEQLEGIWEVSLQATLYYAGGTKKRGDIFIARGIIESAVGHERANVGYEYKTSISPSDLAVTEYWAKKSGDDQATGGEYWITPSSLLAPISLKRLCPTDGLRIEPVEVLSCRLENGIGLQFADNQVFLENENRSTTVRLELVARLSVARDVTDVPTLLPSLDNLLLLGSFAERKRVLCAGWSAWDKSRIQRFYRRSIAIEDDTTTTDRVDPLIKKYEFREFLERANRSFSQLRHRELIVLAINGVTSKSNAPLEVQYMSIFSVLESLVLYHKREHDNEMIVTAETWKEMRPAIKESLKHVPGMPKDPNRRKLIYEKIGELNSPAFRSAYAAAQQQSDWVVDDLWPVADKSQGPSLTCMRNRIVHGVPVEPNDIKALAVATLHLRWTIERALLAILDWPLERSAVDSHSLNGWIPYKDWRAIRESMTNIK